MNQLVIGKDVALSELVSIGAVDSIFFSQCFFPKTVRLKSPAQHKRVWELLDSTDRYVNILLSRGWGKTSILRIFAGKRIAYGISRTIMIVGASEKHSRRTLRWIRNQVEKNKLYAGSFGLQPGHPWTDEELQIVNTAEGSIIYIVALGILGSVRGVNFDDYRPDLIVLDDIMNDEGAMTREGRNKIFELVFGALKESLAKQVEAPFAKLVMINTPMDFDDVSQRALKDRQFVSARFGCWTPETEDLPVEMRKSAWEEAESTPTLRNEYRAAAERNALHIFVREKECRLVAPENNAFRPDWIQYFGAGELEAEPSLHEMWTILVIDPVPPPSEAELNKGLVDKDFEAISVLGRRAGKIYVLETVYNRGHDPNWTIQEFFRLVDRWRVRMAVVESVAYQRTLAWVLREAMKRVGRYVMIKEYVDKRKKEQRIIDGISGIASNKQLFFRKDQLELISQFVHFSLVKKLGKDDVLESVAVGASELQDQGFNLTEDDMGPEGETGIPALEYSRGCP